MLEKRGRKLYEASELRPPTSGLSGRDIASVIIYS